MYKILGSVLMLLAIQITFTSCKKKQGINNNQKVFRTDIFRQNLQNQLGNAVGFSFVITRNGQITDSASFGTGLVNPSGAGVIAASTTQDINIASVTKAFTAMAVIKLMEEKGQLLNFPIDQWLPNSWPKNTAVRSITFRELLTHTSGIRMASSSWDSLRFLATSPLAGSKTYSYANANFGLFRALLPKLNNAATFNNQENNLSADAFERWMSQQYIALMNQLVFNPAGVTNAICSIDPAKFTMQAFNEVGNPLRPWSFGDWTELSGGGGFYLSSQEMARVMAFLVHSNNILTLPQRNSMDANLLGWDPNDTLHTSRGIAYGKDGALFRDFNNDNQVSGGDAGLQTWVGKFPNGVELALSVNSIGANLRNLANIARTAYENAWVDQ